MNDKTVVITSPPPLTIRIQLENLPEWERTFIDSFRIGRSRDCELQIKEESVSKVHAEVSFDQGAWWIRDLESVNGIYVNNQKVIHARILNLSKIELGQGGPVLTCVIEEKVPSLSPVSISPDLPSDSNISIAQESDSKLSEPAIQGPKPAQPAVSSQSPSAPIKENPASVTQVIQRYLKPSSSSAGEHTMLVQQAFDRISTERSKKYKKIIALVAGLLLVAGTVVIFQYLKLESIKSQSAEFFYSMKQMELQLANLEDMVLQSSNAKQATELVAKRQELKKMEYQYDKLVEELGLYEDLGDEGRAIYRVARRFGECETTMPKGFVQEVKKYIGKWKSTKRLVNSLRRAEKKGYTEAIKKVMKEQNIPAQFFFLGLQESNFNVRAVGPKTRYGYAKGVWQFIPATAKEMGLKVGPQQHRPVYDAKDERFHFQKATKAAARYLKQLYKTEAQASGLLVMASYNWGQGNVRNLVRKMPENPRERNFWELLKRFKIPKETYDYVFYIIAAAVISENPKLFGFDFPSPFATS